MKYFLIVLFFTGVYAWADLPNNIQDPAMRESLEMLDTKAISIQKNTQAFSSTTSTSTIRGWLDVGLEIKTNTSATDSCIATCSTGKRVLGGGCNPNNATYGTYPDTNNSWKCTYAAPTTTTCYAICAKVK